MPKYRVKELSLIGNELHQAGAIVEYAGLPAENLEPMDAEGEARYQEYLVSNKERARVMQSKFADSAIGDPEKFAKDLATAIAAANAVTISDAITQAISAALAASSPAGKGKKQSADDTPLA